MAKNAALAGGALVAAGGAGLAYFTKQSFNTLDATAKMASQIGITGQALKEYEHVAKLAGVGNEEFGQTMKEMNKRIGEAMAEQSGSAFEAFAQMGLDAEKLQAIGPDKALLEIADALAKIDSSAQQLQLADKMFGEAGTKLLPLLREGADGIEKMRKEFRDLFGVMDEADFKAIEIANDQIAGLKVGIRGFISQITVRLAPAFAAVFQRMKEWLKEVDIEAWAESFVNAMISGAKYVMAVFQQVKGVWLSLKESILSVRHEFAKFAAEQSKKAIDDSAMNSEAKKFAKDGIDLALKIDQQNLDQLRLRIENLPDFDASIEQAGQSIKDAMQEIMDQAKQNADKDKDKPGAPISTPPILEAPQVRIAQAIEADSLEGIRKIIAATGGGPQAKKPEEQTAKHTKEMIGELREANTTLTKVADKLRFKPVSLGFA